MENLEIVVVGTRHRKPLVEEYLKDIPHKMSWTPDYELPTGWKSEPYYEKLVQPHSQTGQLRCLRGHQDALKLTTEDHILVLEDDAVPNRKDWIDQVVKSIPLLKKFEIVSIHGRRPEPFDNDGRWGVKNKLKLNELVYKTFNKIKSPWGDPSELVFVFGSLAYLIHRKTISKIQNEEYCGLPMDMFIANKFDFVLLDPSPLNHDRSQGSLID